MSGELDHLAARLNELAAQLRDPSLPDERVEEIAREAADLAAEAGSQVDAALRDAAGGGE